MTTATPQRRMELLRRFMLDPAAAPEAQTGIRRKNLLRALSLVARAPATATRATIARETGLTSATASSLVAELIELGLVTESGQAASTGGKRATTLEIDAASHVILVAVVRKSTIETAIVNLVGETIAVRQVTVESGVETSDVVDLATRTVEGFGNRVLAACIQVPGVTAGGLVVESVQLGWRDVPLAEIVESSIGAPTALLNDVNAEALSEAASDAGTEMQRLVVHLGEGVGAAVTVGGTLMAGATGRAGEIGHVRVVFEGAREQCRCGLSGCLESTASMSAMLGDGYRDQLDAADIGLLASTREARDRMAFGARALARALRILSALVDPHEIVIAGAAPALGQHFLGALCDEYEMYPAKGTAHVSIRYARSDRNRHVGPARFALTSTLGDSLLLSGGSDDSTPSLPAT